MPETAAVRPAALYQPTDDPDRRLLAALCARIPEMAWGLMDVIAVARCAGRIKVAVAAIEGIDPVAMCVGRGGRRISAVQSDVDQLVSIAAWHHDPLTYAGNAVGVPVADSWIAEGRTAHLSIPAADFPRAMGRGGVNLQLAMALTGWTLHLRPSSAAPTGIERASA